MAFSVMSIQCGLYPWQTVLMSAMVFAGASQMIAVTMAAQGSSMMAIILTTLIINLRHLIMSTCVMNLMKEASLSRRMIAAFGITDEAFALFTTGASKNTSTFYFFGIVTVTYGSWVIGTILGCLVMEILPLLVAHSLNITLYAMFIGLLVPNLQNRRLCLIVIITAIMSATFSLFLNRAWTIIATTLLGAAIGLSIINYKPKSEVSL